APAEEAAMAVGAGRQRRGAHPPAPLGPFPHPPPPPGPPPLRAGRPPPFRGGRPTLPPPRTWRRPPAPPPPPPPPPPPARSARPLRIGPLVAGGPAQLAHRLDDAVHPVQVRLGQVPAVRVDRQRTVRPGAVVENVPPARAVGSESVGLKGPQRHVGGRVVELG